MIVHRDYNPNNFDNDIALLELESPFILQPHVVPICLPEKGELWSLDTSGHNNNISTLSTLLLIINN